MRPFTRYAWFAVGYNILVILWGAIVRATGSGAGCGRHWPLCNGEVITRPERIETMIELSHRMSSSLSGLIVIVLLVWAYRAFPAHSHTRRAALFSFIFILIEGGLGAGLVLLELVENNASIWRAVAIGAHLLNTFVLLFWLTLTAWSSANKKVMLRSSQAAWLLQAGIIGTAILSAAGAVTALGDTLFLSGALAEQFGEQNVAQHFLVQLRVIHPTMAVFVAAFLFWLALHLLGKYSEPVIQRLLYVMMGIVAAQTMVGVLTIVLRAPIVMQMTHLLLADALWITLLLLTFEVMSHATEEQTVQLQPA